MVYMLRTVDSIQVLTTAVLSSPLTWRCEKCNSAGKCQLQAERQLYRDCQNFGIRQIQHLKQNGRNGGTYLWLPPMQNLRYQ